MEPEMYGGVLNSTPLPPNSIHPTISTNSNINNDEKRSSSRRQNKKKIHENGTSIDSQDERIEVKILPQGDNWGETTTTTTCNGGNNDDTLTNPNDTNLQLNDPIQHLTQKLDHQKRPNSIYHFVIYLLCLIAFISPILFLTLPYGINKIDLKFTDDYTLLLPIVLKLFVLFVGTLSLLCRRRNTIYLPRIQIQKTFFTVILIVIVLTYWLYYILKILQSDSENYQNILSLTSTYEDLLLFLLLLMVINLEIKWLYPKWIVKVVRSPDGQTRQYTIGSMSIQEASVYLLEQYYKDFPVFNPWLENVHQTQSRQNGALSTKSVGSQSNASTNITGINADRNLGRSMREHNDRFYDELDYERRVRKRRTKLLSACEDAFQHVRKCFNEKYGSHVPMDAREAAQAVFSSMSRSLQKYLRITRQQPYFTRESIISHLSTCLSHDLSPRTFLERYTQVESQPLATLLFPALLLTKANDNIEQSWIITCDPQSTINDKGERKTISINQSIYSNLTFVLKQEHAEHIALICTFHQMPQIHLIEKFFDLKNNKFVLKLNSETSV